MTDKLLTIGEQIIAGLRRQPLLAGFLGLALLSSVYLPLGGQGPGGLFERLMFSPIILLWVALVASLAYFFTRKQQFPAPTVKYPIAESLVLLLYIAWLIFSDRLAGVNFPPGYHETSWVRGFSRWLAALVADPQTDRRTLRLLEFPVFTNGILWIVIPLLLWRLLGYRLSELGWWGLRFWWVGLLIGSIFLPFIGIAVTKQGLKILAPVELLANFMNGFKEELLFRGLLQTRLEALTKSPVNGMVLSALVFGLIHVPVGSYTKFFPDPLGALAYAMVTGVGGLALGYLYLRTRSLVPGILIHFIGNTLG